MKLVINGTERDVEAANVAELIEALSTFAGLRATGNADPLGDIAFDDDPCSADGAGGGDAGAAQPISFAQFDDL